MKIITPLFIAAIAHEANRAYCQSLGDDSQPVWAEAPEWQQQSALVGVEMHLANPEATPEQSHESWLAQKVAEGWVYGEAKDPENKVHPCCVPYEELPAEQKAKDYIFRGVVHAMAALAEQVEVEHAETGEGGTAVVEPVPATVQVSVGEQAVTFIGRRESFTDRLYGTGLTFSKGQTRVLPAEIAAKFLRHPDVFSPSTAVAGVRQADADDTETTLAEHAKRQDEQTAQINQLQDARDQVNQMTKDALEQYARTQVKPELDKRQKIGALRNKVRAWIDQIGIA